MKRTQGIEGAMRQLRVTTRVTLDARILDDAQAALKQATSGTTQHAVAPWGVFAQRFLRVAAGVALVGAVAIVAIVLWNRPTEEPPKLANDPNLRTQPSRSPGTPAPDRRLAAERTRVEAMFAARDIDGLVQALEEISPASQLLAAAYLGQIGDARAIPALSQLASQWQGDPTENPFTRAIEQIETRENPKEAEPNVPVANPQPQAVLVPETRPVPVLSGTITDADTGRPIEGVEIRVRPRSGETLYRTASSSNGTYTFETVGQDGSYNVRLLAPEHIVPAKWRLSGETIDLRRGAGAVRDYALAMGAKVVLAVVDEDGRPIPDARFHAAYIADNTGGGPQPSVRADADGTAVIGGLPPTEYLITAAHDD